MKKIALNLTVVCLFFLAGCANTDTVDTSDVFASDGSKPGFNKKDTAIDTDQPIVFDPAALDSNPVQKAPSEVIYTEESRRPSSNNPRKLDDEADF